jgi:hypothetical protein
LSGDRIIRWRLLLEEIARLTRNELYGIPDPGDPEAMASQFLLESEVKEEKFPMNLILIHKNQRKGQEASTRH